jgi:SWIM zinc finger
LKSNVAESFNAWILDARRLSILEMFETIRQQLMTCFAERRRGASDMTEPVVPRVARLISANVAQARRYQVLEASDTEYECISQHGSNVIDIERRACSCRVWQPLGYPCAHAAAIFLFKHENPQNFAHVCFCVESYWRMYSGIIHPVLDKEYWSLCEDVAILPPKTRRPPGRPQKKMIRREDEGVAKRSVHCGRCGGVGHYRNTCL